MQVPLARSPQAQTKSMDAKQSAAAGMEAVLR